MSSASPAVSAAAPAATSLHGLRVLHLIDSGGLYGAEIMLLTLIEEQRRMGATVVLGSIGRAGEPI